MLESGLNLSSGEVNAIVGFLGYGNPCGQVWFIGIEEGLGKMGAADAISNLKARGSFKKVMDLREAHLLLQENGQRIDIEKKLHFTQVWQYMAKIMRAREGREDWKDLRPAEDYIQHRLGRSDGETFLTELSPIPAAGAANKVWKRELERLEPKLDEKIRQRNRQITGILNENKHSLIICYGERADEFGELLDVKWQAASYKVSASADSKCLLLPFLGQGRFSHAVVEGMLPPRLLNRR